VRRITARQRWRLQQPKLLLFPVFLFVGGAAGAAGAAAGLLECEMPSSEFEANSYLAIWSLTAAGCIYRQVGH